MNKQEHFADCIAFFIDSLEKEDLISSKGLIERLKKVLIDPSSWEDSWEDSWTKKITRNPILMEHFQSCKASFNDAYKYREEEVCNEILGRILQVLKEKKEDPIAEEILKNRIYPVMDDLTLWVKPWPNRWLHYVSNDLKLEKLCNQADLLFDKWLEKKEKESVI